MSKFMNDVFEFCLIPFALIILVFRVIKKWAEIMDEAPAVGLGLLFMFSLLVSPILG